MRTENRIHGPAARRPPPFEHVFVATDFSEGSAAAVARTARLPVVDAGRITLLHVLPDGLAAGARALVEASARDRLARAASTLARARPALAARKITVATEIGCGPAYAEIVRRARSSGADLVVLGRHGRRALRDLFIGSTAERVIRAGDLAVLVVSRKPSRAYRRPLLAVDLDDTSGAVIAMALRAVEPAVKAATVVHVYHVPFEAFTNPTATEAGAARLRSEYRSQAGDALAKLLGAHGDLAWRPVLVRGDPRSLILAEAVRSRADLIAIGTHGRRAIAHAILGSVAEYVIRAAGCDVLVARPARISFELP